MHFNKHVTDSFILMILRRQSIMKVSKFYNQIIGLCIMTFLLQRRIMNTNVKLRILFVH